MKIKLLFLFLLVFSIKAAFSQSIKGTVYDAQKEPVIGATIKIDGTNKGAVTDALGFFEIKGLQPGYYKLKITSVGFVGSTKELTIKNDNVVIEVILKEDRKQMDELVVVGYGVQRKRDLTGAVSKIGGKELNDLPVPSFEAAMQGKAAGVQVTVGSGLAGSASVVRVRGISSISASGDPLYVIDGIPITQDLFMNGNSGGMNNNPLSSINPDDIESIEVLKDAAANAIYGSRGANGVILITTKRAQKKGWRFTASAKLGVSNPTAIPKMLNAQQWMQLNQEAWENDGNSGRAPLPGGITYDQALATNTNWVDQTIHTGLKHGYTLTASKGGEKFNTQMNFSYDDNGSYLVGNNFVRTTARVNSDYQVAKWLKVGVNTSLSSGINNRVNAAWSGGLGHAMSEALPIYPIKNADGTWFRGGKNPVRDMENMKWRTAETRSLNGVSLDITPIKDLMVRAQASYDYMNLVDDQWSSPEITNQKDAGNASRNMSFVKNFNYYVTATYLKTLKENHHLQLMVGNEFQRANTIRRRTFASDVPGLYSSNPSYLINSPIFSDNGTNWAFLSYFGRFNYDYKGKYNLQAVYRVDASSRFGDNYRWANFPSLSGAWIISEEDFLKDNKIISFMKLRAGWGMSGNAAIPDDARFGTFSPSSNNIAYNGQPTTYPIKLPNEDLRWETSNNYDLGFEMGFFKDRISFELDLYEKITKDVLMEIALPPSIGMSSLWTNVGGILNRGVEFGFKSKNIVSKDFQWSTNFNVARNYNEITSIGVYSEDAVSGGTNDTRVIVGQAVGANYLIRWSHVDPATGKPVYLDINGNETFVYNNKNRVAAGKILPDAIGGMTNTFRYKNWDMSVLVVFSVGSQIYESSQKRQASLITNWNMDERVFDRWRQPGDIAKFPRLTRDYRTYNLPDEWSNTTLWLKDGSYARLRNLTIGYSIPKAQCNRLHLSSCRVSFIATNLFTLTNYDGLDPELSRDAESDGSGSAGGYNTSRNMGSQNITYLTPPQEKSYTIQVNLEF
jgi:TonB-linked SusC/RagA family outer membrane protein